ncbi:MAG: calcium-binding protein [Paracoccaceae bacterium]
MADHFITTNQAGINQQYTMFTGETIVLQAGVSITASGYSYIFGANLGVTATIDGNVWLEGAPSSNQGSPFYFYGSDTITIGRDATMTLISGSEPGWSSIMLGEISAATGTSFSNHGHIVTLMGEGMSVKRSDNMILNTGMIDLTTGRLFFGFGGNNVLDNSGTITGSGRASFNALVQLESSDTTILNSGEISIARQNKDAIHDLSTNSLNITNSGEITSVHGRAIVTFGTELRLTNTGTITGGLAALDLAAGNNVVINTGSIIGNIEFGTGADTFRGIGGTVTGSISGGGGADTYHTSDSAMQIIELTGGGVDTVFSTVDFRLSAQIEALVLQGFAERGIGNTSNNTITGNGADNRIFGMFGNDSLLGAEGDDLLLGGDGNDTLQGQDGDDALRGGLGNDSLTGLNDNDRLLGGAGADLLRGGTGHDDFVFTRLSDSGTTALTSDLIQDFVRGQDVIDLQAIDANTVNALANDAFTFIGTTAFTGVAGQLRYVSAGGVTTVQMDVNGNGTADMTLRMTGTLLLTASDFIL